MTLVVLLSMTFAGNINDNVLPLPVGSTTTRREMPLIVCWTLSYCSMDLNWVSLSPINCCSKDSISSDTLAFFTEIMESWDLECFDRCHVFQFCSSSKKLCRRWLISLNVAIDSALRDLRRSLRCPYIRSAVADVCAACKS